MSYVEKQYKVQCRECEFNTLQEDARAAIEAAEEHLGAWTDEDGLLNYNHEVEITAVDVVRSSR